MSLASSDFGPRDYKDGRTKQSFKDVCDINKILKKAQKAGGLAHVQKYGEAVYGEFTGIDLLGHLNQVKRAQKIFDDLPSEVRREFKGDALKFAGFASEPENIGRLRVLIPAIAEPDRYFPNPVRRSEEPVVGGEPPPPVEAAPPIEGGGGGG